MNKLLQFNPEPFESEFEGLSYEFNAELENSESESELGMAGRRGRVRSARAKSYRPQVSGLKANASKVFRSKNTLNPDFFKQTKVPGLVAKPQIRYPIIPFIPSVWPVFPFPGRIPEKNEPVEPRTSDRSGREPGSGTPPEQTPTEQPSEYVRWVQSSLNQVMGLRLTIDGILNAETRSAVRSFQERRGLPVTGFIGPDTEQALKDGLKSQSSIPNTEPANYEPSGDKPSEEFSWGSEAEWEFGGATGRVPRLLKQESTPPGTTLYIEIDLGIVDKFGIKAAPMTGIFIPQGFKPDKGVDVILYLHGHKGEQNRRLTIDQYWDRQRFAYGAFREGVNDSGRNVILVAPTLGSHSDSGTLVKPGGLDAYLDQVLSALTTHGPANFKGTRFNVGNLILSCHSGGGWPMRQLAGGKDRAFANLRECWGFDCTYNRGDDTFWANWARSRPNAKVYFYYIAGSQTAPLSESLRNKRLANAIVTASRDKRHNHVPITYWRERIGGASFLKSRSGSPVSPTPMPSNLFNPTAVESPGGGRIQDKRPPAESMLLTVSGVAGKKIKLHRLAGQAWQALVQAARADGIRHPLLLPTSGYRSPDYQTKLWKKALERYKTPQEARKWVAPPGTSAHQSGRAIDFYLGGKNSSGNVTALRQLPAYKWLFANASRFGFYPYTREPWHWEFNPPARTGSSIQEFEVSPFTSVTDVRKMTPKQFIEFVGVNAQRSMKETGVPASVTVAQAILETGWGKHTIGEAKNLFGIKGKGPAGTVSAPTKEYVNGKWITVQANFAKYDSFEQSITEHAKFFIRNRRYAKALQFKNDADRFAREIHQAGYATAPDYSDKLIALMKKHNLYRFDGLSRVKPSSNLISQTRLNFENAVVKGNWREAFLNLNGLSMYEMLRALDKLSLERRSNLISQRQNFRGMVNMPRIEFALTVVEKDELPGFAPGDLAATGQVKTSEEFLRERRHKKQLLKSDIVSVRGIKVARHIAPQLSSLLTSAEADGIKLSGWGYRSNQSQIELRRKHCGTSHYDIYEKPSSQCTPPTARPGASMHEKGLAIDFTHNGGGITNHNNPAFKWLSRNAGRFGLRNLPSEPWHWSVNGR